jgi:preprotein translocase subunit YajC
VTELGAILPILLIVVAFYFLILRPAQKRQADQRRVVSALQPGVQVMTTGGLFGTVVAIEGDQVSLEIADGVVVRYLDGAISRVITPDMAGTEAPARSSVEDDTPGTEAP